MIAKVHFYASEPLVTNQPDEGQTTMCDRHDQGRRGVLKLIGALGVAAVAGRATAGEQAPIGALIPGKGWVAAGGEACAGDGTPLQFMPRKPPDADPLKDELAKYPKCPYCGMDRTEYQHSRHLVLYDDNLVDGTCSIHCLAISLSLNLDRGPKAVYAADFGSSDKPNPMVPVDKAVYLVGSDLKGTMSTNSKMAFSDKAAAETAKTAHGGTTESFDEALRQAYLDMAKDTLTIRKNRAEKRKRMQQKAG
jgi:copper chaperone NosL